jgi:hypothetical protein
VYAGMSYKYKLMKLNFLVKKRNLVYKLLSGFVLSLSLATMTVALGAYKPPSKPSFPKSPTTTTGTRGGCEEKTDMTLTALTPQTYVGQTVSAYPTFAWFVPDFQPLPMEFRLYKYDFSGHPQLIEKVKLQTSPGIMQRTLPRNRPGLLVGQNYLWQVVIFCNPNRPSSALVTEAEIEIVEKPQNLKQALSATNKPLERANLYAELGLWYDAFAEVLKNRKNPLTKEYKLKLLEDLARFENTAEKERIRLIIDSQRRSTQSSTKSDQFIC